MKNPTYRAVTGIVEEDRNTLRTAMWDAVKRHVWWTGELPPNGEVVITQTRTYIADSEFLTPEFLAQCLADIEVQKKRQHEWVLQQMKAASDSDANMNKLYGAMTGSQSPEPISEDKFKKFIDENIQQRQANKDDSIDEECPTERDVTEGIRRLEARARALKQAAKHGGFLPGFQHGF